jgi:hypothetical protein
MVDGSRGRDVLQRAPDRSVFLPGRLVSEAAEVEEGRGAAHRVLPPEPTKKPLPDPGMPPER